MKIIPPEGPKTARIAIVGQNPGKREVLVGRPFVGPSGQFLNALLSKAGISRQDCYITNVFKFECKPEKLDKEKRQGYFSNLQKELDRMPNLELIICLGRWALEALTGYTKITSHRGSVYKWKRRWLIPTFHPADILRGQTHLNVILLHDIRKAVKVLNEGFKEPQIKFDWVGPGKTLDEFAEGPFAFDIETACRRITCLGLSNEKRTVVIPFKNEKLKNYWPEETERQIWIQLKKVFNSPYVKIGQNLKFDLTFLWPLLDKISPPFYDTLLAHHLLEPDLPHDLAFLTSIYTSFNYYKDELKEWHETKSLETLGFYNAKDTFITFQLAKIFEKDLEESNLADFFHHYIMPLQFEVFKMEKRGLLVDLQTRQRLKEELKQKIEKDLKELHKLAKWPVNPLSPKQIQKFLYKDLFLDPVYKQGTRKITTDEKALERLYRKYGLKEISLILSVRKKSKALGTYIEALPDRDGKIRTDYGITETGRLTSKKNIFGKGGNLLNIPKNLRSLFIPMPGYNFCEADLKQAENRMVAWLADCRVLKKAFLEGQDIHRLTASWIYGKKTDEITEEERQIGKKCNHALNYGMGPRTFAAYADISVAYATELIEKYFTIYPEIKEWHRKVEWQIKKKRELRTPFGRRRIFRGWIGPKTLNEAYNYIPQSTIADYLNHALLLLGKMGHRIACQVYDSTLIEFWLQKLERLLKDLELAFKIVLDVEKDKFWIPVEVKVYEKGWNSRVIFEKTLNEKLG